MSNDELLTGFFIDLNAIKPMEIGYLEKRPSIHRIHRLSYKALLRDRIITKDKRTYHWVNIPLLTERINELKTEFVDDSWNEIINHRCIHYEMHKRITNWYFSHEGKSNARVIAVDYRFEYLVPRSAILLELWRKPDTMYVGVPSDAMFFDHAQARYQEYQDANNLYR